MGKGEKIFHANPGFLGILEIHTKLILAKKKIPAPSWDSSARIVIDGSLHFRRLFLCWSDPLGIPREDPSHIKINGTSIFCVFIGFWQIMEEKHGENLDFSDYNR